MGLKNSKNPAPAEVVKQEEEAKDEVKSNDSPNKVVTRDLRSQYLTRMGFGQAGEVLRKYQGMTARDFKVPQ